jgi:hypothetical protein
MGNVTPNRDRVIEVQNPKVIIQYRTQTSSDQFVVLCMSSNPKPRNAAFHFNT